MLLIYDQLSAAFQSCFLRHIHIHIYIYIYASLKRQLHKHHPPKVIEKQLQKIMAYTTNLSESPMLKLMVHFLPTFGSHYYSLVYLHLLCALRRYSGMYLPIRAPATMITNTKATTAAITATLLLGRDGNLAGTKSAEFDVEG